MAKQDERSVAAARVYSRSMLELAARGGVAASLLDELTDLRRLLAQTPALHSFFDSPLVDAESRRTMIERTFRDRASDLLVDSLQVLNRHGRIGLLDTVVEGFRTSYQERTAHVDVNVTSAVALTDPQRQALVAAIRKIDGRHPDLVEEVEPNLLGGMVVRIGDRRIDTSVAKDLRMVRSQLKDRAAREILAGRAA